MSQISALPISGWSISELPLTEVSPGLFLEVGGATEGRITIEALAAYARQGTATADQGAKADTALQPGQINMGTAAAANLGTTAGNVPVLNSSGKIDYALLDLGWTTIASPPTALNGFSINDSWPNLIRANLALRLIEIRFAVTRSSTPTQGTAIFSWSGYISTNSVVGNVVPQRPFLYINGSSLLFNPNNSNGPVDLIGCFLARY